MKRLYQKFASVTCVAIAALLCFTLYMQVTLPDDFYVVEGEPFSIRAGRYITAMEPAEGLPAHAYDQSGNSYHLDLKMFGAIGIKQTSSDNALSYLEAMFKEEASFNPFHTKDDTNEIG